MDVNKNKTKEKKLTQLAVRRMGCGNMPKKGLFQRGESSESKADLVTAGAEESLIKR